MEALTAGTHISVRGADEVDHSVDAKPSSGKIHALEQQLALVIAMDSTSLAC